MRQLLLLGLAACSAGATTNPTASTLSAATGDTGAEESLVPFGLVEIGYCDPGLAYYGYSATRVSATVDADEVQVDLHAFFSGCGCEPEFSGARTDGEDLIVDLDFGYCDGMFCCAMRFELTDVPAGSYTVRVPEVDYGPRRVSVVVP